MLQPRFPNRRHRRESASAACPRLPSSALLAIFCWSESLVRCFEAYSCIHRRFLCRVSDERDADAEPLVAGRLERNVPTNRLLLRILKTKACELDDTEDVLRQVLPQPLPENLLQL